MSRRIHSFAPAHMPVNPLLSRLSKVTRCLNEKLEAPTPLAKRSKMVAPRPPALRSGPSWSSTIAPSSSLREELRLHACYIRDTIAPMLTQRPFLPAPELRLLETILTKVAQVQMRLDLLRYSRMEKALMLITDGKLAWPTDIINQARELLERWEADLGSLVDLRADLYAPGGRMEGLRLTADQVDASLHMQR